EEDLVELLEPDLLVVGFPRRVHRAVEADQVLGREAVIARGRGGAGPGRRHEMRLLTGSGCRSSGSEYSTRFGTGNPRHARARAHRLGVTARRWRSSLVSGRAAVLAHLGGAGVHPRRGVAPDGLIAAVGADRLGLDLVAAPLELLHHLRRDAGLQM